MRRLCEIASFVIRSAGSQGLEEGNKQYVLSDPPSSTWQQVLYPCRKGIMRVLLGYRDISR
jgi:hypothetical protein